MPKMLQNDSPETGDELKKKSHRKIFFIMEKNGFEKNLIFSSFFNRKIFFQVKCLLQKIDFPIEKNQNFRFFLNHNFQNHFSP